MGLQQGNSAEWAELVSQLRVLWGRAEELGSEPVELWAGIHAGSFVELEPAWLAGCVDVLVLGCAVVVVDE